MEHVTHNSLKCNNCFENIAFENLYIFPETMEEEEDEGETMVANMWELPANMINQLNPFRCLL